MFLHIALQEGFKQDALEIRVNGKEVYKKEGVTTRLQTGFADAVETDVRTPHVTIEINLSNKQISQMLNLDIVQPTYLGISMTAEGRVEHRISFEPFGYL